MKLALAFAALLASTSFAQQRLTSEQLRENKDWQFTFGLGHAQPFFGLGLRLGLLLDSQQLVFVDYTSAIALDEETRSLFRNSARTSARQTTIGYKNFVANSFYWEASAFHRFLARRESNDLVHYDYHSQAAGVQLAIGNQWEWQRMTMGCDWVGVHAPLHVFGRQYSESGNIDYNLYRRDYSDLAKSLRIMLLGFYLGLSR